MVRLYLYTSLYDYKINTKNHLTALKFAVKYLAWLGANGGICEAITKQLQNKLKQIKY